MKRSWILMLLFAVLIAGAVGCTATPSAPNQAAETDSQQPAVEAESNDDFKVAMVLNGPINDQSWNQAGYEGLEMIKNDLGAETAFREQVPLTDAEEAMRTFASQGYDMVIGHGDQFSEAGKVVAEEFPDVQFAIVNGAYTAPNLTAIAMFDEQVAYLTGVVAGRMTESGKIGYIGGLEIPPVVRNGVGFEMGAKSVAPDVEVVTTYLGDFNDAAKGREAALAMAEQGVDVIYYYVDQAMLGIHEAASENDIKLIGSIFDQHEIAPELILTSAVQDTSTAIKLTAEAAMDGNLEGETVLYGLDSGAIGLAPFYDSVPSELEDELQQIQELIISGELEVPRTEG